MTSSTHYLLENLKMQLDLHRKLISLQKKKKRAVIERDLGGLEAAVAQEEEVVNTVKRLTEVRTAIIEKLAERFGTNPRDAKLSEVVGKTLEEDMKEVFDKTVQDLSETARKMVDLDTIIAPKKASRTAPKPKKAAKPAAAQLVAG